MDLLLDDVDDEIGRVPISCAFYLPASFFGIWFPRLVHAPFEQLSANHCTSLDDLVQSAYLKLVNNVGHQPSVLIDAESWLAETVFHMLPCNTETNEPFNDVQREYKFMGITQLGDML